MSEHPAVAFLLAAHQQAEETARATTVHQPYDEWEALGIEGDGDIARSIWEVPMIARRWNHTPAARPIMEHIALHDPAAVLRRVAAERQILAEHQPTRETWAAVNGPWPAPACGTCCEQAEEPSSSDLWPCLTVRFLAEAWGWTGPSQPGQRVLLHVVAAPGLEVPASGAAPECAGCRVA